MSKKKEYTIITDWYSSKLQRQVEEHLAEGWECLGGVSHVLHEAHRAEWSQAMIREEDTSD